MNDLRITQYVDDIFMDVKMTATAVEQKEELTINITERVRDYMREGLSFDAAFETVKAGMGDTDELTAPFEKTTRDTYDPRQYAPASEASVSDEMKGDTVVRHSPSVRVKVSGWSLAAISPFVYLGLGFMFGWWAWAWVIIPFCAIAGTPMPLWTKFVSLSPFVYVLLGFFFGWWAWGWIIIPVSAILSQSVRVHHE